MQGRNSTEDRAGRAPAPAEPESNERELTQAQSIGRNTPTARHLQEPHSPEALQTALMLRCGVADLGLLWKTAAWVVWASEAIMNVMCSAHDWRYKPNSTPRKDHLLRLSRRPIPFLLIGAGFTGSLET
eukprot:2938838-Pyramimonas_sp.AAC.1